MDFVKRAITDVHPRNSLGARDLSHDEWSFQKVFGGRPVSHEFLRCDIFPLFAVDGVLNTLA